MEKEYFIEKLEKRKMNPQEGKEFWNNKAKKIFIHLFNENEQRGPIIDDGSVEYLKQFIDFKGKSILDVGFGTGKHLKLMSDEGAAELCGVEMSDEMMKCARKYFIESGMDIEKMELHNFFWEEINLDKLNWRNKFDLVFASKTPALDSYESVKKLISASKKGIFFATHIDISEDVLSEVYREIHGREYDSKKWSYWHLFNILYLDGYYANIKIEEKKQRAEYPTDMMISRYIPRVFSKKSGEEPGERDLNELKRLIKKYEVDGKVAAIITRKTAFIYFEKS